MALAPCIKDGRIEATLPKQHMMKFAHSVEGESEIYMITNFGVLRNYGKFREAAHDYKLLFYGSTKVIPYHKISIPLSGRKDGKKTTIDLETSTLLLKNLT
ncbi:Nucleic acid-binding, OB-fold [Sesbania bispinosa]|nr:Nucleic acid-binding, OB-fold [Sesbania bispinosa]